MTGGKCKLLGKHLEKKTNCKTLQWWKDALLFPWMLGMTGNQAFLLSIETFTFMFSVNYSCFRKAFLSFNVDSAQWICKTTITLVKPLERVRFSLNFKLYWNFNSVSESVYWVKSFVRAMNMDMQIIFSKFSELRVL